MTDRSALRDRIARVDADHRALRKEFEELEDRLVESRATQFRLRKELAALSTAEPHEETLGDA